MTRLKTAAVLLGLMLAVGLGAQTGLSRIGASEARAKEIVMSALQGAFSLSSVARPFLALPPATRAAAVTELVGWARTYFNSAPFRQAWAAEREQAKPQPDARGTVDEELKAQIAEQQKGVDEARKMLSMLDPSQRAAMQEQIKQMEAMLKDPAHLAMLRQGIVAERADRDSQHQEDLKQWQEQYPADYNVLLAKRLRDFLVVSADVDFSAALVTTGSVRRFVDPKYEQQPPAWKMCYRAGREATQAARTAATEWLKALPPAAPR